MIRLLLRGWAQGVGVATVASEMARRCATSAARCTMKPHVFRRHPVVAPGRPYVRLVGERPVL
jgi:hypothetical protein